jgi:mannosyltransferase
MTLLVIAANLITLVWVRSSRETWTSWIRAARWALILSIPLLVTIFVQSRQVSWIKPATFNDLKAAYRDFLGPGFAAVALNAALIAACCIVTARRDSARGAITATRLCIPIFVAAPLLLIAESMIGMPLYGGIRYVVWVLPSMAIMIGVGLDHIVRFVVPTRARAVSASLGLCLLAGSLTSQWTLEERAHSSAGAPQDLLAAATYLHQHALPGDGVIFAPRSFYALRLGYPSDLRTLRDLVIGQSGRYGGRLYGTEMSAPAISDAVEDSTRIWLIGVSSPRGSTRPELLALARGFRIVSHHHVTGMTISLFQTTTPQPDIETEH